MVKFSSTTIAYLNKIFQINENNDKEKKQIQMPLLKGGSQLRLVTKINNLKRQFLVSFGCLFQQKRS